MIDCTIVILGHNGADYTARCLDSILQSQPLPRAVVAVNNGSTDNTQDILNARRQPFADAGIDLTLLANDHNAGCSEARNAAWAHAKTRYTMFLDNDTAVRSVDWLARLAQRLDQNPGLGVIAPAMVYPWKPHLIQCAGVDLNPAGRIRFRGRGHQRGTAPYDAYGEFPALISACWMMRNDLLASTGGLDPLFHPVQYEDLDFCMRVRELGLVCACDPSIEVYHFEGTTTASRGRDDYVRTILANSAKFRERWHEQLKQFPNDDGDWSWPHRDDFAMTDELDLRLITAGR
jgi:GT2 family glycosyltransferase